MNFKLSVFTAFLMVAIFAYGTEITQLDDNSAKSTIEDATKPIIIKAYAEWCPACTAYKDTYTGVANDLGTSYTFAEFDIDKAPNLAEAFGVNAIPTLIFIKNKDVTEKHEGPLKSADLKAALKKNFGSSTI